MDSGFTRNLDKIDLLQDPKPQVPKPEVPKVEIPKVEITKNTNPKTGDNFNAVLYGALIVVAIGGVIFISKKKNK